MATKSSEFDMDDTFDFDGGDFEEFSPEVETTTSTRKPISTSYVGMAASVGKGAAKELVSRSTLKKVVDKALPNEFGELLSKGSQINRVVRTLQDDATKALKPQSQAIVRRLDKLVTKEDTRTRRAIELAKRKLGIYDPRDDGPSEDEQQSQAIASELDQIFKRQEAADNIRNARTEVQNQRRESTASQQFKQSFTVSSGMAQDVSALRQYNDQIGQHWQRKMLELSYRQTFLQTRQVQLLQEGNEALLKQLESIVHNTALPEFSKITLSESWRENSRNKLIDVGNRALFGEGDWIRETGDNLRKQFQSYLGGMTERLAGGVEALDMMMESKASMDDMGEILDKDEIDKMKQEMAGAFAMDWILDNTVGRLKQYVPKGAARYPSMALNKLINGRQTLVDLKNSKFVQENEYAGGIKGLAASGLLNLSSAARKPDPETTLMTGNSISTLDDPSMGGIDNRTKLTINEILPGYMARMLQQLQIANGAKNPELTLYDIRSSKFKDSREILRDVRNRMVDSWSNDNQRRTSNNLLLKFAPNTVKQSSNRAIREAETFFMDYSESGQSKDPVKIRESQLYQDLSPKAMQIVDDVLTNVEQDDEEQDTESRKLDLAKRIDMVGNYGHNAASDMQSILSEGHGWALERLGYGKYDREGSFERNLERERDMARNWSSQFRSAEITKHDVIRATVEGKALRGNRTPNRASRLMSYVASSDGMYLGIRGAGWESLLRDRGFIRIVDTHGYKEACTELVAALTVGPDGPITPEDRKRILKELLALDYKRIMKGERGRTKEERARKKDKSGLAETGEPGVGEDGVADSDINLKENIRPYDPNQSLSQVLKTKVFNWQYKGQDKVHTGPMAQDAQRHMGNQTAPDGKAIDLISMNGKLMGAVQALSARVDTLFKTRNQNQIAPSYNRLTPTKQTDNELLGSIDHRLADLVSLNKLAIDMYAGGNVQIKGLFRGMFDGTWDTVKTAGSWIGDKVGKGFGWAKQKYDDTQESRDEFVAKGKRRIKRGFRRGMTEAKRTLFKRIPNLNRSVQGWFQPYYDVYTRANLETPVLYGNLLRDGMYTDAESGETLRYMADIRGPVKDMAGNFVISKNDFHIGLCDHEGKPLSFKWQGWSDLTRNVRDTIRNRVSQLGQYVLDKIQYVQDVYVKGELEPRLTAAKIEAGIYIDQTTQKVIRSLADIRGEVRDTAGNIVLSAKDFQRGLVDRYGEELKLKFRNLRDLVGTGLKTGIAKGAKALGFVSDMARAGFDALGDLSVRLRESWGIGASATTGKTMSDTLIEIRAILQTHMGPADPSLLPKIDSRGEFVGPPKPGMLRQIRQSFKTRFGERPWDKDKTSAGMQGNTDATGGGDTDVESGEDDTNRDPNQVGRGGFAAGAGLWRAGAGAVDWLKSNRNTSIGRGIADKISNTRLGKRWAAYQERREQLTDQAELKARLMAKHGDKLRAKQGDTPAEEAKASLFGRMRDRVNGAREGFKQWRSEREQLKAEREANDTTGQSEYHKSDQSQDYQSVTEKAFGKRKGKVKPKAAKEGGDYKDQDGDGARDGNYKQRLAEQMAKANAARKSLLSGDKVAKYTEGGVMQQLFGLVTGIAGKIGGLFSGISGLISGVAGFLGLGGAGGGLLSKLGGLIGIGGKAKGVADGVATAASAAQKTGMLGRAVGLARTVGTPIANVASKAIPLVRTIGTVGSVVSAIGGVTGIFGAAVSVGSAIVSAALASPVILGAAAIAGVGYLGYKAFKYFTRNSTDAWQDIRVKQYGLRNDDTDKSYVAPLLELEGYLLDGRINYGPRGAELIAAKVDNAKVLEIFSADPEDEEHCQRVASFLQNRFLPFMLNAATVLYTVDPRVTLPTIDKMSAANKLKFLSKLSFDSGPYHLSVSPFKDLPKLTTDKAFALEAITKLKETVEKANAKDADQKGKVDADSAKKFDAMRQNMLDAQAKREAAAKAAADAKKNVVAAPKVPSVVPAVAAQPGQGDGAPPTNQAVKGGAGAPPAAGGAVLGGLKSSQYLQLAQGVTLNGMNPKLMEHLNGMAEEYGRATGKSILIKDGFRSYQQQQALYNRYKGTAQEGRAAPPGSSLHEFGLALDFDEKDAAKLESMGLMRKYGFTRPVGGESWHVEPAGIQGAIRQAKDNADFASARIAAGLGRGGGGYGTVANAARYKRDESLAAQLLGLPAKSTTVDYKPPADNQRPVTVNGQNQSVPNQRPAEGNQVRPAQSRGGGYVPAGYSPGQGDGAAPTSRPPAGYERGIEQRGIGANPQTTPGGGRDISSKVNANGPVKSVVAQTSKAIGADPNQMLAFAAVESGLDPNARNKKTGATGLFQFLPSTWQDHFPKAARRYDMGSNPGPQDPLSSTVMAHDYVKTYIKGVSSNPSITDMYLVHFLGGAGARKFLSMGNDTIAATQMPKAARQNAEIFYSNGRALTKAEIYNNLTQKLASKAQQFGINPSSLRTLPAGGGNVSQTTGGGNTAPSLVEPTPQNNSTRYSDYSAQAARATPVANTSNRPNPTRSAPQTDYGSDVSRQQINAVSDRAANLLQESVKLETQMLEELRKIASSIGNLKGMPTSTASTPTATPQASPAPQRTPAAKPATRQSTQVTGGPVSLTRFSS